MEVSATAKYIRVQPRKVRIIADKIRGKNASHATALLNHHTSKGAKVLRKVLISAMANALENNGLAPETLKISTIMVNEGPVLKRMTAKAMGRGGRIQKKTSHITVVVENVEATPPVKPYGTRAKPRPTFNVPEKKAGFQTTGLKDQSGRDHKNSAAIAPASPSLEMMVDLSMQRRLIVRLEAGIASALQVGSRYSLGVRVGYVESEPSSKQLSLFEEEGKKQGFIPRVVLIRTDSPDFEVSPVDSQQLRLPLVLQSDTVRFDVVPLKDGDLIIRVTAYEENGRLLDHVALTLPSFAGDSPAALGTA